VEPAKEEAMEDNLKGLSTLYKVRKMAALIGICGLHGIGLTFSLV